MKKRILSLMLGLVLVLSAGTYSFAEEIPVKPTEPEVQTEESVNEYNKEVDKYNEEVEKYNKQTDEDYAVAQTEYETQKKEVTTHNQEEQNKVEQNEKDLEQYEKDLQQYEEYLNSPEYATDKKNADAVLAKYDSIAEYNMLPFKAGDDEAFEEIYTNHAIDRKIVKEENVNLKDITRESTIQVDPAEEKSGKTYTVIVTHYFINPYWQTIKAVSFSKEEVDINDTVTVTSLANNPSSKLVLEDDEKYCAFYTYISNTYLTCYWYQIYGYAEHTRLKVTDDFSEYNANGNAYDFTLKNGSFYSSDAPYFEVLYYYTYWNTVNELLEAPEKVTKYNPDFWEEPIAPTKRDYLNKLSYLIFTALKKPTKTTTKEKPTDVTGTKQIQLPTFASSTIPTVTSATITAKTPKNDNTFIGERTIPLINMDKNRGRWALINLILTILTILSWIVLVILNFKENRRKILPLLVGLLTSILAILVFIFTEDMRLPMVLIDKWTIIMLIIFLIEFPLLFIKHKNQEEEEE